MASIEETEKMEEKYRAGNYGYGHAKTALYELILEKFSTERERYNYYMENLEELDKKLAEGASKAKEVALPVLSRVRGRLGYLP